MERYIDPPVPAYALEAERITWHLDNRFGEERKFRRDRFREVHPDTAIELAENYQRTHANQGYKAANLELYYATRSAKELIIPHWINEDQLRRIAALNAEYYRRILFDETGALCRDITPIAAKLEKGRYQAGFPPRASNLAIARRIADKTWWLRALRKVHRKQIESWAIDQGMVHKDHSIYVSRRNFSNRKAQKSKMLDLLAELVAVNEDGEELCLSDLHEHSLANPAVRRSELMVRVHGLEAYATENGLEGVVVTVTCPSRMHAARNRPNRTQLDQKPDPTPPKSAPNPTQYLTESDRLLDRNGPNSGPNPTENLTKPGRSINRSKPVHRPIATNPPTDLDRSVDRSRPASTGSNTGLSRNSGLNQPGLTGLKPGFSPDQTGNNPVFSSVEPNPSYDGTKPDQAHKYLCNTWSKTRSKWKRDSIEVFGLRITEPNHDGTPHWHLLLFCAPEQMASMIATINRYFLEDSADEPGAKKHRVKVEKIDPRKGSAIGYIAKYIAKNLDGHQLSEDLFGTEIKETCERVDAWRATWRIRGFQFIGAQVVGVWRELRRLREATSGPIEDFRKCADEGDFKSFINLIGGPCVKAAARVIDLTKAWSDKPGKYGDPTGYQVTGVSVGNVTVLTRLHTWTIERRARKLHPLEFCQ